MHPRSIRPALCACLLASSLLLCSAPAAQAKSIAKDDINVRSGPSTQDEILFTVPRGYPIEVQERSGQWTRFQDWQGNSAWVYSSLVSDVNTAVILVDKANIRSAGSTSAKVAAVAEIGEIYKVLNKKGDWVQLGYYDSNAPVGWIRHDLVFGE
jgi:SH3-like domain-containing protein